VRRRRRSALLFFEINSALPHTHAPHTQTQWVISLATLSLSLSLSLGCPTSLYTSLYTIINGMPLVAARGREGTEAFGRMGEQRRGSRGGSRRRGANSPRYPRRTDVPPTSFPQRVQQTTWPNCPRIQSSFVRSTPAQGRKKRKRREKKREGGGRSAQRGEHMQSEQRSLLRTTSHIASMQAFSSEINTTR